jgi:hypothetical protein
MVVGLRVQFDPEGVADDTFDYQTGQVWKPLDDDQLVYDELSVGDGGRPLAHPSGVGGRAFVSPVSSVRSIGLQIVDGAQFSSTPYEIWVPLDAPTDVGVGAIAEVVHSEFPQSDPGLLGRQFKMHSVLGGAVTPARVFIAVERTRGPD